MILATRTLPAGEAASAASYRGSSTGGQQPFVCQEGGAVHVLYCGIIDFLQPWVFAKKVSAARRQAARRGRRHSQGACARVCAGGEAHQDV